MITVSTNPEAGVANCYYFYLTVLLKCSFNIIYHTYDYFVRMSEYRIIIVVNL